MTISSEYTGVFSAQAKEREYENFLDLYPSYTHTGMLDSIRDAEFSRLDRKGHAYLDYTGSGLYADRQLREHQELLYEGVFGNPHSSNPSSLQMTNLVESTRESILSYFNASPAEYEVVFTLNASGSLKIIGESFPFSGGSTFLLSFDNHNSVNGIREYARAHSSKIVYVPLSLPEMRLNEGQLSEQLQKIERGSFHLFAYPAQSNFSGIQHSLDWIAKAKELGWYVLLDAAAFVPTNELDLGVHRPDFVAISFYKMFGYPTGVGCLIARRSALKILRRPWFAGGTITVASVQGDTYYLAEGASAFEDGTLNFLSIPAVEIGLRFITSVGIDAIHERVRCLSDWLIHRLMSLHHDNGAPLVRLYGADTPEQRGGAVSMNFYDRRGHYIDHMYVEQEANKHNISLRTGCFCNPGGGEAALGLSKNELLSCFKKTTTRLTVDDFRMCIDDKSTGAVRVSLGLASNFSDVYRYVKFAEEFILKEKNGS